VESIIWPSLVVGPVPISLAATVHLPDRWQDPELPANDEKFNMDPTSLSLMAIDMLDIRQERSEAFEYLVYVILFFFFQTIEELMSRLDVHGTSLASRFQL
jgi:hypothetical protein